MSKIKQVIRYTFVGFILGLCLTILMERSVWLAMRIQISLLIPLCAVLGMLKGLFFKNNGKYMGVVVLQLLFIVVFAAVYWGRLEAVAVLPAIWLRESFYLSSLSIGASNLMLLAILAIGNCFWIKYNNSL